MSVHILNQQQLIPGSIEELWDFFSSTANLSAITPPYMKFTITSEIEHAIYTSQLMSYKVSPLFGIPLSWVTEITAVKQYESFIDVQKKGPYQLWHHKHDFQQTDKGILMTDVVHYQLPLYFLGDIVHSLFIKQQLRNIFDYRHEKIGQIFGRA
jgi:ligand-binding SRPBCC domain-containing protein